MAETKVTKPMLARVLGVLALGALLIPINEVSAQLSAKLLDEPSVFIPDCSPYSLSDKYQPDCKSASSTEYIVTKTQDQEVGINVLKSLPEAIEQRGTNYEVYPVDNTKGYIKVYPDDVYTGTDNSFSIKRELIPVKALQDLIEPIGFNFTDLLKIPRAYGAIATTSTTGDGWLDSTYPTENHSTEYYMYLGRVGSTYTHPTIKFVIPDITDATFATTSLYVYRINTEGQSITAKAYYIWSSREVQTNQMTYNVYSTGNSWTTSGGDISTEVASISMPATPGAYSFNVSSSTRITKGASVVYQLRNDGTSSNYGVIGSLENTTASYRPYLLLEYSISTSTSTTSASSTSLTSSVDNDSIEKYLLYWFYVMLAFIILTIGYWIVDKFTHLISKSK